MCVCACDQISLALVVPEGGLAEATLVGSIIRVRHHVVLQVQLGGKLTTAHFTHDRFWFPFPSAIAVNSLLFARLDAFLRLCPEIIATHSSHEYWQGLDSCLCDTENK